MLFREESENREYEILNVRAAKSRETRGRTYEEEKCDFRTEFQRDRDRIVHSKSFRRLMHKTQVFLSPEGDHYRTRLTHTLEVAQVSRTVARILRYNEDLTEAIAFGHDLGHTPFGHNGESVLAKIRPNGFLHNEQSLRTVDKLEVTSRRRGLNLTEEVRDGILNHRGDVKPLTYEGQIVKICDRIAYINHDIDDAIRSNIISMSDLPKYELEILGSTHSDRINNLIVDLCKNSEGRDEVCLSPDFQKALLDLRTFMFSNVYNNNVVQAAIELNKVETVISSLYSYYNDHPEELPELYLEVAGEDGVEEAVKDYISGMTDRYAIKLYSDLFVPKAWQ